MLTGFNSRISPDLRSKRANAGVERVAARSPFWRNRNGTDLVFNSFRILRVSFGRPKGERFIDTAQTEFHSENTGGT